MKQYCLILLLIISTIAYGQKKEPVKFTHTIETSGNNIIVQFIGTIDDGWHIYSTHQHEYATSTTFNIDKMSGCTLDGDLKAFGDTIKTFDTIFKKEISYFEKNVIFEQHFKINADEYNIEGYLEYGVCNDISCLPPTAVNIKCNGNREKIDAQSNKLETTTLPAEISSDSTQNIKPLYDNPLWKPVSYSSDDKDKTEGSLWLIFFSCFIGGLLALLTPCIWPIIPMTVSFFLKRTDNRGRGIIDSFIYGLSIIVIYLILGLSITYIAGPNALNALSTNAIFNIFFTLMLLTFGFSFLGAFDINLPSSWTNAVDAKANRTTGLISIFLMAFTLALVSFSCTGPIIGFLLVEVSTVGNFIAPAVGMAGFAIALALPFTLFALFPTWLNKLPRSGSWMMTMKTILGFIEIAFAFKFFSVADLAYGWHLLDRETFIVCWAALSLALGLNLFGIIRLRHDSDEHIGTLRLTGGIISIAFALYLIPGLWGAPLKAVSAFAPPMYTQDFVLDKKIPEAKYYDFDLGMAEAKKMGRPALIDFTGYGCVNCREMEQAVMTDENIAQTITNDFVLISLYVDDKTPLPIHITINENGQETILRTIGDKWSFLERYKFDVNAQPFYVALDSEGNLLTNPISFNTDIKEFESFLQQAKQNATTSRLNN